MADITDADYMHPKTVSKDFEIKNLGEYHAWRISYLLDFFWVMRLKTKICLKIYHFDPAKYLLAPGLAWQAALKNTEENLQLLTDIDMLLMV